jgi:hypothetical protein
MENKLGAMKLNQLATGVIFMVAGIFAILFALIISPSNTEPSVFLWMGLPLFLFLFVEMGLYQASQSIKIDEEKLKMKKENVFAQIWHAIALYTKYSSLIKNIFSFLTLFVIVGIITYTVIIQIDFAKLIHSTALYVQLATYGTYFLILRPIIKKLFGGSKNPIKKWNKKIIPDYALEPDGLAINLYYHKTKEGIIIIGGFLIGVIILVVIPMEAKYAFMIAAGIFVWTIGLAIALKNRVTKYSVRIKFNEINEIKDLSYVETNSFMKYELGPNVNLQMQATGDLIKFLRKEIPKPSTYIFGPVSSARTLLIKGQGLFYLTSVSNENCNDLIHAFKKFKAKKK